MNIIRIIIFFLPSCLFAQENSTLLTKSYYRELNVEGGLDWSMIYNDTIAQKLGTLPYFTVYYDNFISQHLRYSFFLTPVAIHQTLNNKSTLRERYFQIEGGLSGSYAIFDNWWLSAGGGYARRILRQKKVGANAWQEVAFEQPWLFFYGSTEYWLSTTTGLRFSSLIFKDGYVLKIGLFINYNSLKNRVSKKEKSY